jgi:hypothetical protein
MNYKLLCVLFLSGCTLVPGSYKVAFDAASNAFRQSDNSLLEVYARNLEYSNILITINNSSSVLVLETSINNINTYVSTDGIRLKFEGIKLIESSGLLNDITITNFNHEEFLSRVKTSYYVSQSNPKLFFEKADISYKFNADFFILEEAIDLSEIHITYKNLFFFNSAGTAFRSIQHVSPKDSLDIQFFN